jgi:hypothetical protein
MQMGGTVVANTVVYNSQHCKRMADDTFSMFLNPEQMEALEAKSTVLPFGLLRGDEPMAPPADDSTPPRIVYNHRFEAYKDPTTTFTVFADLRTRHSFEVWVTQASGQATGGRKKFHFDKVVYAPARADYLNNIAIPAVNTINSLHETFCISILDSLAIGHLVVLPNAITFPELVPPDYPFLFNSPEEQTAMLESILTTWPDEYNKWREPLAEHARTTFDVDTYVDRYLQLMWETELQHRQGKAKPRWVKMFADLFDSFVAGEKYSLKAIHRELLKNRWVGTQACPYRRVIREAMIHGGIDIEWHNGLYLTRRK